MLAVLNRIQLLALDLGQADINIDIGNIVVVRSRVTRDRCRLRDIAYLISFWRVIL